MIMFYSHFEIEFRDLYVGILKKQIDSYNWFTKCYRYIQNIRIDMYIFEGVKK